MTSLNAVDLLKTPALRLLLAYVILFGLFIWYGRSNFYRDPGSVFFDRNHAFEEYYTQHRRAEAQSTLSRYGWPSENNDTLLDSENITKASTTPQVCVTFLTVKRKGEQYIEEAFGSALAGLAPEERRQAHIGVFFAHTDPREHPTYNASWLWALADSVYSYDLDAAAMQNLTQLEEKKDWYTKSVFDYTYALEWCHATGAPYALLLEGDVLLADSWLVQILSAIQGIQERLQLTTADWLYLRLFNQERSTGWAGRHIGDNHEFVICLGIITVAVLSVLLARRSVAARKYLDNPMLVILCLMVVPSTVILFFQSGKASLLPPRPGLKLENFGCCSQALLYPREQIPPLVTSLRDRKSGSYDLMINEHARDMDLRRVTLYPILVQHLGVKSSSASKDDEARSVWSTAFESLRPAKLHDKHKALLQDIFHVGLD